MKDYYFIDWTIDWADEGDVCGFEIIDKEELDARYEWLDSHKDATEVEIYWGTNESVYLSANDIKEYLDSARHLTKEQYNAIVSVTGRGFGYCNWFEDFVLCYEEELEEDE